MQFKPGAVNSGARPFHPNLNDKNIKFMTVIENKISLPASEINPPPAQPATTAALASIIRLKSRATGQLPHIDQASALIGDQHLVAPHEIVGGLLHAGTKGVLASGSKVGKTWILLNLAASVASGIPFLRFDTRQSKVLFINFEIRREFIAQRLKIIQHQNKLTDADLSNLYIWNLRGQTADFGALTESIIECARKEKHALIILDPIYKAMVGKSENVSSSVGVLCNQIEQIVEATGAAVIFAHHFSKGNAAKKNQTDRMSGSGVFARDADTIITLTEHEQKDCYSVEMTLRNLAPQSPFVIEWQYPVIVERPDLSPSDFKSDEPEVDDYEPLVCLLDEGPLTTGEWLEAAIEIEYSRPTFFRHKAFLVEKNRVQMNRDKTWSRKNGETAATT